jgi:hypothetical protein
LDWSRGSIKYGSDLEESSRYLQAQSEDAAHQLRVQVGGVTFESLTHVEDFDFVAAYVALKFLAEVVQIFICGDIRLGGGFDLPKQGPRRFLPRPFLERVVCFGRF